MKLEDFLRITPAEEGIANNLLVLAEKPEELSQLVKETELVLLIRLAIQYPAIDSLLKHEILDPYWQEIWRKSGNNPDKNQATEDNPFHEYLPQPTLHTFELLKGIYFHWQYLGFNESAKDLAFDYLQKAAELNCFTAMRTLCYYYVNKIENTDKKEQTLLYQKALELAARTAEYYWTPGYLLLAEIYQFMAQDKIFLPPLDHSLCFQLALTLLCVAENLEAASIVHNLLNNAYPQKNIQQANNTNYKTWLDAKIKLSDTFGKKLTPEILTRINMKAKRIADTVSDQYPISAESELAHSEQLLLFKPRP